MILSVAADGCVFFSRHDTNGELKTWGQMDHHWAATRIRCKLPNGPHLADAVEWGEACAKGRRASAILPSLKASAEQVVNIDNKLAAAFSSDKAAASNAQHSSQETLHANGKAVQTHHTPQGPVAGAARTQAAAHATTQHNSTRNHKRGAALAAFASGPSDADHTAPRVQEDQVLSNAAGPAPDTPAERAAGQQLSMALPCARVGAGSCRMVFRQLRPLWTKHLLRSQSMPVLPTV